MPTKADAPVLPGARAIARYVRTSPTKARRMINLVRGLPAKEASRAAKAAATEPTDEPKTEEPKTEEPKVEEPKAEEPKAEEPKKAAKKAPAKKATTEKAKAAAEEETE